MLMTTLIFGLMAISRAEWTLFNGKHSKYGFAVIVVISFPVFFGITLSNLLKTTYCKLSIVLKLKIVHKVLGFLLVCVA
jgi:hypothetical protein